MTASASAEEPTYTAVVHAVDGVRFVARAQCPERLSAQIVGYIRERCDNVLWPSVANQVRAFVEDDKPYAAIALYFAHVGERWDEERLELGGLSFGAPAPRLPANRLAEAS
jgi:hypothetical protein